MLARNPGATFERERLRIFDFYLLFPGLIPRMKLPHGKTSWRRRFRERENPYVFSGDPRSVFQQVRPVHEHGVALLAAKGLLDVRVLERGFVQRSEVLLPAALQEVVGRISEFDRETMEFFDDVLRDLGLLGPSGLKARTGLLDFRYDAT